MATSTPVFLAPDSDVYFCFGAVRKTQWLYIADYTHDYISILESWSHTAINTE